MLHAKIAKRLVKKDPSLMLPKNKNKLRKKIDTIYERDHALRVTLSPTEIDDLLSVSADDNLNPTLGVHAYTWQG